MAQNLKLLIFFLFKKTWTDREASRWGVSMVDRDMESEADEQ
jgi:hypothetical protein